MRPSRRLLLVSLLATVLLGLQALQASPLHDHNQHSVDCALCHLQLSDLTLDTQPLVKVSHGALMVAALPRAQLLLPSASSPYLSRAPPIRLF